MIIERNTIENLIEAELADISNKLVLKHVKSLLVRPEPIPMKWDYGPGDQHYSCWIVLMETSVRLGIAYCNEGFGPKCPWGLVTPEPNVSMGMDCAWFPTFMEAYIDGPATEIPIWRVVKKEANGHWHQITEGGEWKQAWTKTMALRAADVDARYDVESIALGNS